MENGAGIAEAAGMAGGEVDTLGRGLGGKPDVVKLSEHPTY